MLDKDLWKSKTLWFNVLALLVIVGGAYGFGEFEGDPKLAEYAAVVVTIINLLLRFVTKQPLKTFWR